MPGYRLSTKCHSPVIEWEVFVFFSGLFQFVDEQDFSDWNHKAILKLVTLSFSSLSSFSSSFPKFQFLDELGLLKESKCFDGFVE